MASTTSANEAASVLLRPPLKWAGGKRWLVPHLHPLWRKHRSRRYVEPFCGGLAVALGLCPDQALLNDVNPHPVNLYRWIQRGLTCSLPMANDRDLYYRYRVRFNELIRQGETGTREAAELFYFLNRTCYNGLCRVNSAGEFNVPFGSYKTIRYQRDFDAYASLFRKWSFTVMPFEAVPLERGDFVYADPPYDVDFTRYARDDFRWEDQVRLAEWLAGHRGVVLLSNQATGRILRLYRRLGFSIRLLRAPRRISCTGDRTAVREVLAFRGVTGW